MFVPSYVGLSSDSDFVLVRFVIDAGGYRLKDKLSSLPIVKYAVWQVLSNGDAPCCKGHMYFSRVVKISELNCMFRSFVFSFTGVSYSYDIWKRYDGVPAVMKYGHLSDVRFEVTSCIGVV